MSKASFKERNKAIRLAWEREQELVAEGKGTRDWSPDQQKDILDPEKGKAYDENGRAYEGQHMKSAAEYPEYQGNPDNIQFLTRNEHLEAHKGSWQNPTNWYYDSVTKEFIDFGDGDIIPCKAIELSSPISPRQHDIENKEAEQTEKSSEGKDEDSARDSADVNGENASPDDTLHSDKADKVIEAAAEHLPIKENPIIRGIKSVGRFIVNHPVESLEIAAVAVKGVYDIVSSVSRSGGGNSGGTPSVPSSDKSENVNPPAKQDISSQIADIVEKANRATPHENDVPAHKQRYHTKDGVVWKEKAPYHRGGKEE